MHITTSMKTALVYSGPGAGTRSVVSAVESLRRALRPSLLVDTIDTDQLLEGTWTSTCTLLVMPGGADLPYCRHLNGAGNAIIRNFVHQGGAYLGLCAGAYYACSRVEFEPDTMLEVIGDRELAFYPGIAQGSIYSGFDYQSENGAVAAPLRFKNGAERWQECRDYVNGGPGFMYPVDKIPEESKNIYLTPSSTPPLPNIEILATFPEKGNAAAAIACQVGLGRAVLCSTHPELGPQWLTLPAGGGRSDAVLTSVDVEQETYSSHRHNNEELHVQKLQRDLVAHEAGRWEFWKTLLIAAGLEEAALVESYDRCSGIGAEERNDGEINGAV